MAKFDLVDMTGDAIFSADCVYRYRLTRHWAHRPPLPVVMLNPSIAGADKNDPTINRCIAFAKREGLGGLDVINLYGLISTNPYMLKTAVDPFGPENVHNHIWFIAQALKARVPILCAWGTDGAIRNGDLKFLKLAKARGVALCALGITKDGHPKHPLYLAGNTPMLPYMQGI